MKTLLEKLFFLFGMTVGGAYFVLCSAAGIVWLLLQRGNRQTLYVYGKVFCRGLARMMGWSIEVGDRERLEAFRPCVIVGNHQSFLDVVTFGAVFPRRTVSAGKREIGRIPIFGWFYRLSGNLIIDRAHARSALESLEQAARTMREEKIAVWFMPEGHRNQGPELLPFKNGAFRLALAAGVPIVPIVAEPLTVVCDTNRHLARPGRLRMRVLEPVPTEGLDPKELPALVFAVRSSMQAALDSLRS
ncbi:MAG TPA: lysophospholipid acyltransferase family protein [Thermoanaerobaculia bacterium]|nr:lysophospholipid acyltransferase family protein [Thermoanaerobaculia bacterium]